MNSSKLWKVYLAGEIHSDWREQIINGSREAKLPIEFSSPVTHHESSDDCGVEIFGEEENSFWKDAKGAGLNSIRTRVQLKDADIVVVRFGEKYRQWNAAFDAGFAAALGKPIITLHPPEHNHALKEMDSAAAAVAETPQQIVRCLQYIINGQL